MQAVSEEIQPSVFILWGNFAASKRNFINEKKTSDYRELAPVAAFFLSRVFRQQALFSMQSIPVRTRQGEIN